MDKRKIAECFARARQTYDREARVQHQVAEQMLSLLLDACPPRTECTRIVEVGCGTGIYSRLLLQAFRPQQLWLNDSFSSHSELRGYAVLRIFLFFTRILYGVTGKPAD